MNVCLRVCVHTKLELNKIQLINFKHLLGKEVSLMFFLLIDRSFVFIEFIDFSLVLL